MLDEHGDSGFDGVAGDGWVGDFDPPLHAGWTLTHAADRDLLREWSNTVWEDDDELSGTAAVVAGY